MAYCFNKCDCNFFFFQLVYYENSMNDLCSQHISAVAKKVSRPDEVPLSVWSDSLFLLWSDSSRKGFLENFRLLVLFTSDPEFVHSPHCLLVIWSEVCFYLHVSILFPLSPINSYSHGKFPPWIFPVVCDPSCIKYDKYKVLECCLIVLRGF